MALLSLALLSLAPTVMSLFTLTSYVPIHPMALLSLALLSLFTLTSYVPGPYCPYFPIP